MATFLDTLIPSVHDTLTVREALSKLAFAERMIKSQGVTTIVENFNIVYSCLVNINELKQESIDEIIGMIIKGLDLLENDLRRLLSDKMASDTRVKYLNTLKILTYLMVEFTNHMEKKQQSTKEIDHFSTNKKAKKPAAKKTTSTNEIDTVNYDWNDMKAKILDGIAKIIMLNIQKLWDPPIAEEQFVILITNLCYKLMENCQANNLRPQQKKILKDHLCHILGLMIKKYNHSYGACVMIVQTLPHYEHFSALYADLIQTCVTQLGYESILPDLLREFRHSTTNASSVGDNNLKYYSQFLIDLSDRLAPNLLPYISLIQDFLDDESYLMRNSILYIYGEIIVKVLNQEATSNDLKLKQMRNELLDTLTEHLMDVHSTTRSRTLQIWKKINEEKSLPLNYMNVLMKKCIERMEDSASGVRKNAFQLLCDLIRKNPYGITSIALSLGEVEKELVKEQSLLEKLNAEGEALMGEEEGNQEDLNQTTASEESDLDRQKQEKVEKHKQQVLFQTSKVNYLKDTHDFIKHIESAIPKISRLLFSNTQTDVLEVISFFVTCFEAGLMDMVTGIRKMLALVTHSEKNIKDAVVNAYKRLYLKPVGNSTPVSIAKNLMKLVQDLTCYEREALEELMGEFTASGELDNAVIQILWEFFANNDQASSNARLNALILLGMIVKRVPEKGRANIQVLIDYGFNISNKNAGNPEEMPPATNTDTEYATDDDMIRFSETCLVFSCITQEATTKTLTQQDPNKKGDKKGGEPNFKFNNQPFKLPNNHPLFERLSELIVEQFKNLNTMYWTPMVDNAIQCIYKLADNPITLTEEITHMLMDKLPPLKALTKRQNLPPVPLFNEPASQSQTDSETTTENVYMAKPAEMSRFFTYIGILSTKFLVFLNQSFVTEIKRRKMCSDKTKENKKTAAAAAKSNKQKRKSIRGDALEEEMGMSNGAEAEDAEVMFIENLIDQKVSKSGNGSLIAQLLPAIVHILKEPKQYDDDTLQLSCALALCKIMVLSQSICNQYVQLLFTLVEKSPNPLVRSQLIIGIGDLVYRFPNALEPWTSHLYLPLRDTKSTVVRMNTIRVLSHLILKEMIKTRGQIYEIALCTIDENEKICSMSKAFFQELSKRNNGLVIYNAMPDIISQLSGGGGAVTTASESDTLAQRAITEESFRTIVTYLFTFIKRDKQCETLIEKLCHAFRQANSSERKCRDLAFCLSKIQLSESGVKKLKETFKWYADKLCIPAVYDTFKSVILKNARKLPMLKNETKMLIDELEKQIDDVRAKGADGDVPMEGNAEAAPETQSAEPAEQNDDDNNTSPKPTQRQSQRNSLSAEKEPKKRGFGNRNTRGQKLQKRNVVSSSDDSDSD